MIGSRSTDVIFVVIVVVIMYSGSVLVVPRLAISALGILCAAVKILTIIIALVVSFFASVVHRFFSGSRSGNDRPKPRRRRWYWCW